MSPDKTKQLVDNYPIVFTKVKHLECSDGWFGLLNSLCSVIELRVKSLPLEMQGQIYAVQIKSKYGGLRAYFYHTIPVMDGAIELAEDLSNNICEDCGNPGGHKMIDGWVQTLCEPHYTEMLAVREAQKKEWAKTQKEKKTKGKS